LAFKDIPITPLLEALHIVMSNNLFIFGNNYWQQIDGTAMGTPLACDYAYLFFSCKEERMIPNHSNLNMYKRYIDDVIGVWVPFTSPQEDQVN